MKNFTLIALTLLLSATAQAQLYKDLPKGDYYPGYNPVVKPDASLTLRRQRVSRAPGAEAAYPDHWNTGAQRYFPPIFSQGGYGSCGVSSHVGYMMTSELNAWQNTDASLPENQLTPMFEYPFTYNGPGKDDMALYVGFPTADVYGGRYESSIYMPSEHKGSNWSWMQGYKSFYNAMLHRISYASNFPESTDTEEGRAAVKAYLYNHNGDETFGGRGGTACVGVGIASSGLATVPTSDVNRANGFVGQRYLEHWNIGAGNYDHAMCIVGYDDRIQFDLDGNGQVGEIANTLGQNENGAWIMAQSYGAGWGNAGFIYCPYALDGGVSQQVTTPAGKTAYKQFGGWQPYVYHYRTGYTPLRTMKVLMDYSKRSEISVVAGVAQDTAAAKPEKTFQFAYINYTGDGDGDGKDAATPLLGTWNDGISHTEPMEFGIDLTDLTDGFDSSRPLKYFLIVNSKSTADGNGHIHAASVIDYEFNKSGVEFPFDSKNVEIQTAGKQTIISVVVNGEPLHAPTNLILSGNELSWTAPTGTAYVPTSYYIYRDDNKVGENTSTNFTTDGTAGSYCVKAAYMINGTEHLSAASNQVGASSALTAEQAYDNNALAFDGGGFFVPDVVNEAHDSYTVEMWLNPNKLIDWADFMFHNLWGAKYMMHTSADGSISAGWNNNNTDRINTPANTLVVDKWTHIALVIEGNNHRIYADGNLVAEGQGSVSGFPAYWAGRLYFGDKNSLNGTIDELRLWTCARSGADIKANMRQPIADPTHTPNLQAYFKMDTYDKDGKTYIKDWVGGHDAEILGGTRTAAQTNGATISRDSQPVATIQAPAKAIMGEPISIQAVTSVATTAYTWTATNAVPATSTLRVPTFTFSKTGIQTLKLKTTDLSGATAEAEATIEVEQITPTADFVLSNEGTTGNDRISFIAQNKAPGCTYLWSMPGADNETASTANASASYATMGTKKVTLTVTGPDGATYTSTQSFEVRKSTPATAYQITPQVVVKGSPVLLTDQSGYAPTSWKWSFRSSNSYFAFVGKEGEITPEVPGIYTLTYTVGNEIGNSSITANRALIVCNAASETGLNFYEGGSQRMDATLSAAPFGAWTIDYWLNPLQLSSSSLGIQTADSNGAAGMKIVSDASGNVKLSFGEASASADGFYIPGEWHHYAITHSGTTVSFYRDGTQVGTTIDIGVADFSNAFTQLTLGGTAAPMKGSIDELRVWNRALSQNNLREVAVAPISDVNAAMQNRGLLAYWQFNQPDGNAVDACGHAEGRLTGFANTVNYYTESKGVFALNFDPAANESVVGQLLTKSNFSFVSVSDYDSSENATGNQAIDGDEKTFWHSKWEGGETVYPHSITLKRTVCDTLRTLQFSYARADRYRAANVTVEQSNDNVNWEVLDSDHVLFSFALQNMVLAQPATAPYVRITFNSGITGGNLLCLNEINFYGTRYDESTGISVPQGTETGPQVIYDLQGRRVNRPLQPGIYIINGKKQIVR